MVMRDANGTLFRCYIPELASSGGTGDASGEGGSSVGTVGRLSTARVERSMQQCTALKTGSVAAAC